MNSAIYIFPMGTTSINVTGYKISRECVHKDWNTVSGTSIISFNGEGCYKLVLKGFISGDYRKVVAILDAKVMNATSVSFNLKGLLITSACMIKYSVLEIFQDNMIEVEIEYRCKGEIEEGTT